MSVCEMGQNARFLEACSLAKTFGSPIITKDGVTTVKRALGEPIRQVVINAGVEGAVAHRFNAATELREKSRTSMIGHRSTSELVALMRFRCTFHHGRRSRSMRRGFRETGDPAVSSYLEFIHKCDKF